MTGPNRVEHVTCLGCGCGCDDITVTLRDGRIVDASPGCPVGREWFGDGMTSWDVLRSGSPASLDEALAEAAAVLVEAGERTLVYLAPDLTSQAQRLAVGLADLLRGMVDCATSETAASGLLAGQRRGRATATLGEIRNRADVLVFWGVDPTERYHRYLSRYALEPAGTQVPGGRAGRFVIAVGIGADRGPSGADLTLALEPEEEIPALSLMRAAVLGRGPVEVTAGVKPVLDIVPRLLGARYAVLVHDAEPTLEARNPLRAEALIALTQALNGPTRAALSSLRAGGNRTGAEAVLTWQTGYPFSVSFSSGCPRYAPGERGLTRLTNGAFRAALVVGSPTLDDVSSAALRGLATVAVGPRASRTGFAPRVAIDTGVAGIHEAGTAYRMDEVPLQLRPPLADRCSAADTLRALTDLVRRRLARRKA